MPKGVSHISNRMRKCRPYSYMVLMVNEFIFYMLSTYICTLAHFNEGIYHNYALYVDSLHRIWYKWTFNRPTPLGVKFGVSKSFPVLKTEKITFSEDGGGRWGRNWLSWQESNLYLCTCTYVAYESKKKGSVAGSNHKSFTLHCNVRVARCSLRHRD